MKIWKLLIPFCAVIVVGCASTGGADGGADGAAGGAGGASSSGVDGAGAGGMSPLDPELVAELMENTVIYFGFDSSNLHSASLELAQ